MKTDCSPPHATTAVQMAVVTPAFKTQTFGELGLASYFKLSFARAAFTTAAAEVADVATVVLAAKIASELRAGFGHWLELFAHGLKLGSPSASTWLRSHCWEVSS